MRIKVAGVAAAITAVLIQFVEHLTNALVADFRAGDAAGWLPQLESPGLTLTTFLYASDAVTFLLAVPLVGLLGYVVGQSVDVSETYLRIFANFAVGGGIGFILATVPFGPRIHFAGALFIVGGMAIATGIKFAFVGLAGAALAEFGVSYPSRRQPIDNSTVDITEQSG